MKKKCNFQSTVSVESNKMIHGMNFKPTEYLIYLKSIIINLILKSDKQG